MTIEAHDVAQYCRYVFGLDDAITYCAKIARWDGRLGALYTAALHILKNQKNQEQIA